MPNFRLNSVTIQEILKAVEDATEKKCRHAEDGFPMDATALQIALMRPEWLKALSDLEDAGFDGLPKTHLLTVYLAREYLPELHRNTVINIVLPAELEILTPHPDKIYVNELEGWSERLTEAFRLDVGLLSDEHRAALTKWANHAVRERRLKKLTDGTVAAAVDQLRSTAAIAANWPLLATFINDAKWKARVRNAPEKLKRYVTQWVPDFERRLRTAEVVLLGADMMPAWSYDGAGPVVTVVSWEPLPTDPAFA